MAGPRQQSMLDYLVSLGLVRDGERAYLRYHLPEFVPAYDGDASRRGTVRVGLNGKATIVVDGTGKPTAPSASAAELINRHKPGKSRASGVAGNRHWGTETTSFYDWAASDDHVIMLPLPEVKSWTPWSHSIRSQANPHS